MPIHPLSRLPKEQLIVALDAAVVSGRTSEAAVLAHIAEFDRRKLYAEIGYTSMYRYCVEHLRMSEDVAFKRVRVARVARQVPAVLGAIESGRLNLSGVALLAKHVIRDKAVELLVAAEGRTRREIEVLIAERFPRVDSPLAAEVTLLGPAPPPVDGRAAHCGPPPPAIVTASFREQAPGPVRRDAEVASIAEITPPSRRARLAPVGPGQYELVVLLGQEAYDQLLASRDLLGHAVPSGDLAEVIERAIALQLAHLRRRRCGAADRPRASTPATAAPEVANPRRVPRAVVRAVWKRDGGQCTFVGTGGHRCEARDRLELDHIVPFAQGGKSTVENLRLLCHAHNQHVAEQAFGAARMKGRIEAAQRRRAEERLRRQADRERTQARKAEIAKQAEELGEAFRLLGYRGQELQRALACCATRPEAPPEERVRYALGFMAPKARRECPAPDRTGQGVAGEAGWSRPPAATGAGAPAPAANPPRSGSGCRP